MPKKYHIDAVTAPPRFTPVGKSGIVDWGESCLKCHNCVKKRCLYQAYQKRSFDSRLMVDSLDALCKNCFRCVQECTKGILSKSANPEYSSLGDGYFTPDIIANNWYQAETGKIPVSGAGYGGPFIGPGFDDMWTDMSEIVRPTRDGIHGREYISTSVDLGRKPPFLEFTEGGLSTNLPPLVEVQLPILFNLLPLGDVSQNLYLTLARAATELNTFFTLEDDEIGDPFSPYLNNLVPHFKGDKPWTGQAGLIEKVRIVQITHSDTALEALQQIKKINPKVVISVQVPLNRQSLNVVHRLADKGAEIIHLYADSQGMEWETTGPRFFKDVVREVHLGLVHKGTRDAVTLMVSGGIAMAEHVAKIIICGADAVAVDIPLLLALECRLCRRCAIDLSCPVKISEVPQDWGVRRLKNLIGAWRNQLLEVLGAMGLREIRRLRGEAGRAIFFKEIEQETFGKIFGEKPAS